MLSGKSAQREPERVTMTVFRKTRGRMSSEIPPAPNTHTRALRPNHKLLLERRSPCLSRSEPLRVSKRAPNLRTPPSRASPPGYPHPLQPIPSRGCQRTGRVTSFQRRVHRTIGRARCRISHTLCFLRARRQESISYDMIYYRQLKLPIYR
ncbi:hypothetical protein PENSPDRAFT_468688 [Peniophora sp. CONT]|nr:hypothetical protein PENSPDRAFT_468688 [Peniophora sp. CONT]